MPAEGRDRDGEQGSGLVQLARWGGRDGGPALDTPLVLSYERSQPVADEHRAQVLARGTGVPLLHS